MSEPKWIPFAGQPVPKPERREEDFFRDDWPDHLDESEECPHGVLYCEPCTACFPPRWENS